MSRLTSTIDTLADILILVVIVMMLGLVLFLAGALIVSGLIELWKLIR